MKDFIRKIKENLITTLLFVIAIENLIYILISEIRNVYSIEFSFISNLILFFIIVIFWLKHRKKKNALNEHNKTDNNADSIEDIK